MKEITSRTIPDNRSNVGRGGWEPARGIGRLAGLLLLTCAAGLLGAAPVSEHTASLVTDQLEIVIADNAAYAPYHGAGYNGASELRLKGENQTNLFVPFYAGLNLEHIFNGNADTYGWDIFEPRRAPMELVRRSKRLVELRQERTEHWPLRSRVVFGAKGDAIDLAFHATPLEDFGKSHGYIGIFFASYIRTPEDMSIQFIGRSRPGQGDSTPRWIRHLPAQHGLLASHRPAGSNWDPTFDPGFKLTLASGFSDFEYLYPFYFGRSGDNVLLLMFDKPRADGEMRFAQSPSGGGTGNPAWDFVYFQRKHTVGRQFSFRVRAVYRKFTSVEDLVRTYEKWSGEKVKLP